MRLPDTEFLINLGDWPLARKREYLVHNNRVLVGKGGRPIVEAPKIPMFSWCKNNDTYDILLPTYEITEATLECMGR